MVHVPWSMAPESTLGTRRRSRTLRPADGLICGWPQNVKGCRAVHQLFHSPQSDLRVTELRRSQAIGAGGLRNSKGGPRLNHRVMNSGRRRLFNLGIVIGADFDRCFFAAEVGLRTLASVGNGGTGLIDHVVRFCRNQNAELSQACSGAELRLYAFDF